MKLTLLRTVNFPENDAQFGEMRVDNTTQYQCLTLERISVMIPAGLYPVSFYSSPHNQLQVPLLTVPGRTYIEIHPANYPAQLEGCIAVGTSHNQDSISNSRFAFDNLMALIKDTSDLTIEIIDSSSV